MLSYAALRMRRCIAVADHLFKPEMRTFLRKCASPTLYEHYEQNCCHVFGFSSDDDWLAFQRTFQ